MKNERTQRDHDIIRQSSLKAAVDLTLGMLPQLEDQTEISDLVLRLAGKFQSWVLNGQPDRVQEKVNGIRDELDKHPPRKRQPAPADPPDSSWDKLMELKDQLVSDPERYHALRDDEWEEANGRWFQRGQTTFGASPGDPYPVSSKQFGYLVALHRERTLDTDTRFLLGLSTDGASDLIEHVKAMPANGKPRNRRR